MNHAHRPRTAGKSIAPARPLVPGHALPRPCRTIAAAVALALAALVPADMAFAQAIGELDVRSAHGEAFFGSVPVDTNGRPLDPGCIRVRPHSNPGSGASPLPSPRIRVNPTGAVDSVVIETATRITEPVVGFRLEVGCENPVARDFLVMVDPPAAQAAAVPAPPPPAVAATPVAPPRRAAERPRRAAPAQVAVAPPGQAAPPVERAPAAKRAPAPAPAPAVPARKAGSSEPRLIVHVDSELKQLEANTSLTDGQREALRRTLALRGRDDEQLARLLELQHRIAAIQAEADKLRAALEQAAGVRSTPAGTPAGTAPAAAAAGTAGTAPAPSALAGDTTPTTAAPAAAPAGGTAGAVDPTAAASSPAPAPPSAPATASAPDAPATAKPAPTRPPAAATSAPAPRKESWFGLPIEWIVAAAVAAAAALAAVGITLLRRRSGASPKRAAPGSANRGPGKIDPEKTVMLPTSPLAAAGTAPTTTLPRPIPAFDPATLYDEAPPTADFPAPPPIMDGPAGGFDGTQTSGERSLAQRYMTDTQTFDPLGDPEAVVRKARIYYLEDGDPFKAIDLLELAVAGRPGEARLWHGLFAIYRREEMNKRYEMLARTYHGKFRDDEHWPTIQGLGREIDVDNPLYQGTVKGAQTDSSTQEVIDRWLGVPLDFTAQLLSNELHDRLTSGARRGPGSSGDGTGR